MWAQKRIGGGGIVFRESLVGVHWVYGWGLLECDCTTMRIMRACASSRIAE